ncbi:hypothetical protein [Longimicrobium sp.]|uniref:hypothetical protein n=1 Tax=Longimicrobium sp. TaxID=2029185 RepID=UPI002E37ACCA|nr:hypothetical protein [Longimicrobium sp.]HEX6036384.1 hypothetical protein [Longimicrobium sp.]
MLTARVVRLLRPHPGAAWARTLAEVLGWTALGGDRYAAGGVAVEFGAAWEEEDGGGGARGLDPTWELEAAPADWESALRGLCGLLGRTRAELEGSVAWDARGASLRFHDPAGGLTTLLHPTWRARAGRTGRALGRLLDGGGSPVVGVTLHVASLPRAQRLYRDALGLAPLRATPREARLDAGPLLLALRAERRVGMVADAARRGARGGALVVHAGGVPAAAAALEAQGFGCRRHPDGTARVRDADGHRLVLAPADAETSAPSRPRAGAAIHEFSTALEVP